MKRSNDPTNHHGQTDTALTKENICSDVYSTINNKDQNPQEPDRSHSFYTDASFETHVHAQKDSIQNVYPMARVVTNEKALQKRRRIAHLKLKIERDKAKKVKREVRRVALAVRKIKASVKLFKESRAYDEAQRKLELCLFMGIFTSITIRVYLKCTEICQRKRRRRFDFEARGLVRADGVMKEVAFPKRVRSRASGTQAAVRRDVCNLLGMNNHCEVPVVVDVPTSRKRIHRRAMRAMQARSLQGY